VTTEAVEMEVLEEAAVDMEAAGWAVVTKEGKMAGRMAGRMVAVGTRVVGTLEGALAGAPMVARATAALGVVSMAAIAAVARWVAMVRVATKEEVRPAATMAAHREVVRTAVMARTVVVRMAVMARRVVVRMAAMARTVAVSMVVIMVATPGARGAMLVALQRRRNSACYRSPGPTPTGDAMPLRFRASSDMCGDWYLPSRH